MVHLPDGYSIAIFDSIDSTNEEARRHAATARDRTVYWAKRQTAGRGRRGRSWMSEPGNLFVSLLLKPDCPLVQAAQLSFVSALAISDVLMKAGAGDRAALKWPNDVLVDGAKICGILLEATSTGAQVEAVIVGIGLNLVSHPDGTPYPATDFHHAGLENLNADLALTWLLDAFELRYAAWRDQGFPAVRADWLIRAWRLGQDIQVQLDGETVTGRFAELDESGALVVETPAGARHITAGDVYFPGAA
ncbi:biotin--[acetyl-CoA-carboxylase] ligase [Emcibacter sp. SYSU 3D8]|uniref:biotin--[acetyl-CoA-carboxylase] ligase n=1 Tax=Emcibacter sp. SYSU 3D8 TaxID=3133969 RepID=UPI0031FE944B